MASSDRVPNPPKPLVSMGPLGMLTALVYAASSVPVRNTNGPDEQRCPFCHASNQVMGHAWGSELLWETDITHHTDCVFVQAANMLNIPHNLLTTQQPKSS